jgi:NifB/MoaA-like Fe-S oxidoreductase
MHGNFITLTNISSRDISKIISFKVEPLHVSLHSFDPEVRNLIFGNKTNIKGLKNLIELDRNRIKTNIQIVLCPGINDGEDLKNTLNILIKNFIAVKSVGIVPVGITKFCKSPLLKPFTKSGAAALIRFIEEFKDYNSNNKNAAKIYLSDEFYLIAGHNLPPLSYYGKLYQIKNGIGKSADFLDQFYKAFLKYISKKPDNKIYREKLLIITSEYGKDIIWQAIKIAGKFFNLAVDKIAAMSVVKNDFLGANVKVTGLLSGNDIMKKLSNINLKCYDRIIVPDCIFNPEGLTIDNMDRESILKYNSEKIFIIPEDGKSLAGEFFRASA